MSVLKKTFRFCVLAAASLSGSWLFGQNLAYHPFAEPLEFDPDWQLFAPVQLQDIEELTPRQRANEGWFLTYDRVLQGMSRPAGEGGTSSFDYGWGNRWDFGVMSDDSGWLASVSRVDGPNNYDVLFQNRLNLFNADDDGDPLDPLFPAGFRNDQQSGERSYYLKDSINVAKFTNVEVNKTWRMSPYRYGGILEPMIGLRFTNFTDYAQNDNYFVTNTDLDGNPGAFFETLTADKATTYNQMLLGQIGFRYMQFTKRWTLSSEFRAFGGQNFQSQVVEITDYRTEYTAIGVGNDPSRFQTQRFSQTKDNTEGTVGLDFRAEAAYKLFRSVQVRGGFNLHYFGTGVWRGASLSSGNDPNDSRQAVVMPGFTLGFEVNR